MTFQKIRIIFFVCFFCGSLFSQSENREATQEVVKALLATPLLQDEDFKTLDSILYVSNYFVNEFPIQAYQKAVEKAIENEAWSWAGYYEHQLTKIFEDLDQLLAAKKHGHLSMDYYEKAKDDIGKATIYGTMRVIYVRLYDYEKAFTFCYEALKIFERENDRQGQAMILEDIGSLLTQQKKFEEGIENFEAALAIAHELKDIQLEGLIYAKLAVVYKKLDQLDTALHFATQSLSLSNDYPSFHKEMHLANRYYTRASIYQMKRSFEAARKDYYAAIDLVEKINYIPLFTYINNGIGESYFLQEDFLMALNHFKAVDQELKELGAYVPYDMMMPLEENLSKAYAKLGQYDQAYWHATRHSSIMDSVFNLENNKQINELREIHEAEKKEAAITRLEDEKKIRNKYLWITSGLLLLSLVLGYLLWRDNRFRKQLNFQLQSQNETIARKSRQNEILVKEIHHRVKNNLQVISSLLSLQKTNSENKLIQETMQKSQSQVQSMAIIHKKLYQGDKLATVDMKTYFRDLGENIFDSFDVSPDRIKLYIPMDHLELELDVAIPIGLIVNELITNSLKHGFGETGKGRIELSLKEIEEKQMQLTVSDNGSKNIGDQKTSKTAKGFGIELVDSLALQIRGQIEVLNQKGMGRTTIIRFQSNSPAS